MNFHNKYKRTSYWWVFIRQSFVLEFCHHRQTLIFGKTFEDDKIILRKNGLLCIKAGFDFGASGPTWDTKSSREASCVHDALYYLSDKGLFEGDSSQKMRQISDTMLYTICLENGMWEWRAKLWLKALEIFGGWSWESEL